MDGRNKKDYIKLLSMTECGICNLELQDPRRIECSHTFCLDCLIKHASSTPSCPTCKRPMKPRAGKVENYPVADEVVHILQSLQKFERCSRVMEDADNEDHYDQVNSQSSTKCESLISDEVCDMHGHKVFSVCLTCDDEFICTKCSMHSSHKKMKISEYRANLKDTLDKRKQDLLKRVKEEEAKANTLENMIEKQTEEKNMIQNEMEEMEEEMFNIIHRKKDELLQSMESRTKGNENLLTDAQKQVTRRLSDSKLIIEKIEKLSDDGTIMFCKHAKKLAKQANMALQQESRLLPKPKYHPIGFIRNKSALEVLNKLQLGEEKIEVLAEKKDSFDRSYLSGCNLSSMPKPTPSPRKTAKNEKQNENEDTFINLGYIKMDSPSGERDPPRCYTPNSSTDEEETYTEFPGLGDNYFTSQSIIYESNSSEEEHPLPKRLTKASAPSTQQGTQADSRPLFGGMRQRHELPLPCERPQRIRIPQAPLQLTEATKIPLSQPLEAPLQLTEAVKRPLPHPPQASLQPAEAVLRPSQAPSLTEVATTAPTRQSLPSPFTGMFKRSVSIATENITFQQKIIHRVFLPFQVSGFTVFRGSQGIYYAFVTNDRDVKICKENGEFYGRITNLTKPFDVASQQHVRQTTPLYVTDEGRKPGEGSIKVYNADGNFAYVLTEKLRKPQGIAISDELIYVCDDSNILVLCLTTGKRKRTLSGPGKVPLFVLPLYVMVSATGKILVFDVGTKNLKIHDGTLKHTDQFQPSDNDEDLYASFCPGMCSEDSSSNYYVIDPNKNLLYMLGGGGRSEKLKLPDKPRGHHGIPAAVAFRTDTGDMIVF
ncbi:uncharacterized protein [Argopecten irradians]|uniref:uncharacterized protein n=1 Tax=Argopecten irradians TaxID=31199 RepID=UPI00372224AC